MDLHTGRGQPAVGWALGPAGAGEHLELFAAHIRFGGALEIVVELLDPLASILAALFRAFLKFLKGKNSFACHISASFRWLEGLFDQTTPHQLCEICCGGALRPWRDGLFGHALRKRCSGRVVLYTPPHPGAKLVRGSVVCNSSSFAIVRSRRHTTKNRPFPVGRWHLILQRLSNHAPSADRGRKKKNTQKY